MITRTNISRRNPACRTAQLLSVLWTICFACVGHPASGASIELRVSPIPEAGFNLRAALCAVPEGEVDPSCLEHFEPPKQVDITIEGVLAPGDDVRLSLALAGYHKQKSWNSKSSPTLIYLNSPGGDVDVALRMGKLIRQEREGVVTVDPNHECLSACVLLVAAGKVRELFGVVGIHRIFSASTKQLSYEQAIAQRRSIEIKVKTYLKDMNVSPDLYDAMDRISPEDVKVLSEDDLGHYGLSIYDPVFEEMMSAADAERLGISRIEYNQRSALAKQICVPPRYDRKDEFICHIDVLSGKLVR